MNSFALINQPPHFFSALLVIVSFLSAAFANQQSVKKFAHKVLYVGYALILISGCYLFATLPFSSFVLIKAVGGVGLVVMAEMIVRGKGSTLIWTLLLVTASAGLGIAYFLI
ncbi:DUF1516 family protein [Trichlorobacter lovleyi]|jgi:Protein of unknown function (DUF1516).|uniref:Uncharacterized protein n=1 Tax=Trichlorobacter lovleyi (strain ATCC BAA-1151 / DSM 17278 / SZ) TaxID=398767 RepID=B3EBX1_TRIL1|nr:DUF1516 family protein [Trichlorobacter lovleyi]ACD97403.1 hypothetical protein Glov_3705 [Trichlorobacter lovleyi SZ]